MHRPVRRRLNPIFELVARFGQHRICGRRGGRSEARLAGIELLGAGPRPAAGSARSGRSRSRRTARRACGSVGWWIVPVGQASGWGRWQPGAAPVQSNTETSGARSGTVPCDARSYTRSNLARVRGLPELDAVHAVADVGPGSPAEMGVDVRPVDPASAEVGASPRRELRDIIVATPRRSDISSADVNAVIDFRTVWAEAGSTRATTETVRTTVARPQAATANISSSIPSRDRIVAPKYDREQ